MREREVINSIPRDSARLTWFGHAMFAIDTSIGRIVTDPFDEEVGYKLPKPWADVLTLSHHHHDHGFVEGVTGNPRIFDKPGVFDVEDIRIEGISSFHDSRQGGLRGSNVMFRYDFGRLRFAHVGDLGHPLGERQLERLTELDVLLVPVGGTYTIDGQQAADLVQLLKPKVAVPMHYKTPNTSINIATAEGFTERFQNIRYQERSVVLTPANLPAEPEIWVMKYEE